MTQKHTHSRLHIGLLLAIFLMAQSILLIHQTELEEHAPGEICEFCLHVNNLGHSLSNTNSEPFTASLQQLIPSAYHVTLDRPNHSAAFLARAPPVNSTSI